MHLFLVNQLLSQQTPQLVTGGLWTFPSPFNYDEHHRDQCTFATYRKNIRIPSTSWGWSRDEQYLQRKPEPFAIHMD